MGLDSETSREGHPYGGMASGLVVVPRLGWGGVGSKQTVLLKSLPGNTDLPPRTQHLRVRVSLSVKQGLIAVFKLDCCEAQMSQFKEIT